MREDGKGVGGGRGRGQEGGGMGKCSVGHLEVVGSREMSGYLLFATGFEYNC